MFDRDGGRYAAVLIILVAALLLSLWAYLEVQTALLERGTAYQQYVNESGAKQQAAADKIANECATIPIDRLSECLGKHIAAYQSEDDRNKDLEAQQGMAFWAEVMVYVTGGGIVVSAFGLIALVISLSFAWKAIEVNQSIGDRQTRPYLVYRKVGIAKRQAGGSVMYRLSFQFVNAGTTPAIRTRYVCTFYQRDRWGSGTSSNKTTSREVIAPGLPWKFLASFDNKLDKTGFLARVHYEYQGALDGMGPWEEEIWIAVSMGIDKNRNPKIVKYQVASPDWAQGFDPLPSIEADS